MRRGLRLGGRVAASFALVAIVGATCRSDQAEPGLRDHVVGIEPEVAAFIEADLRGARPHRPLPAANELAVAYGQILGAAAHDSASVFLRRERLLAPYLRHIVRLLDERGERHSLGKSLANYLAHSVPDRMASARLNDDVTAFRAIENTLPPAERVRRCEELIARASAGNVLTLCDMHVSIAEILPKLGRRSETPDVLRRGVECALAAGDTLMVCQLLGSLGAYYAAEDDDVQMRAAWDRGLELARSMRSWQEARMLYFYFGRYRVEGELAIARDTALEIQERLRAVNAPPLVELRFLCSIALFFVDLECWDMVGRNLARGDVLLAEARADGSPVLELDLQRDRLDLIRVHALASTGRCDEAARIALAVDRRCERWDATSTQRALRLREELYRPLLACGRTREARSILEDGLRQARTDSVPVYLQLFATGLARVALASGDTAACRAALEQAGHVAATLADTAWLACLRTQLAVQRGDGAASIESLRSALQHLDAITADVATSPESDLASANFDVLRQLGHRLLAAWPEAGYAFEMRWRSASHDRRRFASLPADSAGFVATLVADARRTCAGLARAGAVHLVYDVRENDVVRFEASGSGVTRANVDAVAVEPLGDVVRRAHAALAEPAPDPARPVPASLAADLRQLATRLLPEGVRAVPAPATLLVTANGWLSRLPFETLNTADSGYQPLLETLDVASVRGWNTASAPGMAASDSAIVVAAPAYAPELRRRYSVLTETLPNGRSEAAFVAARLPRCLGLFGSAATKRRLRASWERAPLLYFAGHSIQDAEVPYVMFFPMARPPDGRDNDSYLGISDVRGANLSRCRLVVLSSCASGANYSADRGVRAVAPSLADAFLDAGAGAVVGTRWPVRDDVAARTMTTFMRLYVASGQRDPIGALSQARLQLAAETPDPHVWAAFSVALGTMPETASERALRTSVNSAPPRDRVRNRHQ